MKIKAVIFDLDGTLLDTIDDLTAAMNAALAFLGFPGHSTDSRKNLVGEGIEHFARQALPPDLSRDEATVARCVAMMRAEYCKCWAHKTHPYEGIPELLDGR